ncbi:Uncharacterised protein [Mycobacteroides abscessus subsp. massiliense]|nr:Uncharacterised protein [Mycobacteroides abscessus subsp. massiliense]
MQWNVRNRWRSVHGIVAESGRGHLSERGKDEAIDPSLCLTLNAANRGHAPLML